MFGPELRAWIITLGEGDAVAFIRSLLMAEANRLGLPEGTVRMTGIVKARDRGIDGRTEFPDESATLVPTGPQTWQIKATNRRPDIDSEIAKDGVQSDLLEGRGYVLVWTRDPPLSRTELEQALGALVIRANADSRAKLFGTEDIERLSNLHPAVVQAFGGPRLLGLPLFQWAEHLRPEELQFVSDPMRGELIDAIRAFAGSSDLSTTHLHIYGDTGLGKSRLMLHALATEAFQERVFASPDVDDVHMDALEALVSSGSATGILLVDDVDWADARRLATYAAAAQGRLRLLTAGERPSRDALPGARNFVELRPMEAGGIAALVASVSGLAEEQARTVASMAEGYPKLAVELASAIEHSSDPASLLTLIRAANVSVLLESMLPDPIARRQISHLALVDRLGFEGGLEFESDQLCKSFGLDPMQFRAAIDAEEGRFVSTAGRYRLATPLAFAVWLVRELIRTDPAGFADRVVALPAQLFDAFRRQVEFLGEDPYVAPLLTEVMARKGGDFHSASELTSDFARFLHALAFALPDAAAQRISALVGADDIASLQTVEGDRRRQLVWALEHLLWFSSTFTSAAGSLFRLALAENEDYGNNATGTLIGAFGVHLGGTEVSLPERVSWLRETYRFFGLDGARLAVQCCGTVLGVMETRMGGWRGARTQPDEWRPATVLEEQDARRTAFALLLDILAHYPQEEVQVAKTVAENFRGLVSRGLVHDALDFLMRAWSPKASAEVQVGLREALYFEKGLPEDIRSLIGEALSEHQKQSLDERLAVALLTPYWELTVGVEEKLEGPEILKTLAAEVVNGSRIDLVEKHAQADSPADEVTLHAFFQSVGRADWDIPRPSQPAGPNSSFAARTGFLIGRWHRGDHDTVRATLREWSEDGNLAEGIAVVVHQMPADETALELVLRPVESGIVPPSTLNRLMFGAWIKPLAPSALDRLLRPYVDSELTYHDLDAALHMVWFWVDGSEEKAAAAPLETAAALIGKTGAFLDRSGGLPYVRAQLLESLPFSDDQRLGFLLMALSQRTFPTEGELQLLASLARADPERVTDAVIAFILNDQEGWSLYLSRSHIVSVLASSAGLDVVGGTVARLQVESQIRLLQHLDFTGSVPDPLFIQMLERTEDDALRQAAITRYFYPGEVVVGSYADYLEQRLATIREWGSTASSDDLRQWAEAVAVVIESEIPRERLREAEENPRI